MSGRFVDINKKIAYLTHAKCRHSNKLKTKDPIALQNKYFAKKAKNSQAATSNNTCHVEMMDMLDCLKRNKGCNHKCGDFIASLLACEKNYKAEQEKIKVETQASGMTEEGRIDPKVANNLLGKHPNQPSKQGWAEQRNSLVKLDSVKVQPFPYEDDGREYRSKY